MKTIILITVIAIISQIANTQTQTFEWVKQLGGASHENAQSIVTDDFGNIYMVGNFEGTTDFDPGPGTFNLTSGGDADVFISKIDAYGNFLWAKQIGGVADMSGYSIAISDSGNIYTTGSFLGTADFDPGVGTFDLTSSASFQIFISKLDNSGNFVWAKEFGLSSSDIGYGISVDDNENIYVTGQLWGNGDFDPGPGTFNLSSQGISDIFISKLDHLGNLIWVKHMGGIDHDRGSTIDVDALGNVYTSGSFQETVDFDPGIGVFNLTSGTGYDAFISKLDADGNFIWAKQLGRSNTVFSSGKSIVLSDSGNVYTLGSFSGTGDFDPGTNFFNLTAEGGSDVYISKLDTSGNFVWAKQIGGIGHDSPGGIDVDAEENIYFTGGFSEVVDFDPGPGTVNYTSEGFRDIFITKLDNLGNLVWARQMGDYRNDLGATIVLDPFRNIYTAGIFSETVDFNSGSGTANLIELGQYDVFLHKIAQCSTTSTDLQSTCNSLTWIDGNTYSTNNNTAMFNIVNGATNGCDSLVTLGLTINSNTGTDEQTACDSYTWIDGNTYTTDNNTATFTLTNAVGCDSVVTLNLTLEDIDVSVSDFSPFLSANANGLAYQWIDCDDNYEAISGENFQFFFAEVNGNYAVEITQNGCKDTSDCITVSNVGINKKSFANNILVYPNPTKGEISIDLVKVNTELTIRISNVLGQTIHSSTIEGKEHTELNIEGGKGVYFVELSNDQGERSLIKVIKN
jgi:hypothetical protein